MTTKIIELQVAIRNAEREKVKAESRLNKLREGGVNVDDYIDAFVYQVQKMEQQQATQAAAVASTEWPESETASEQVRIPLSS